MPLGVASIATALQLNGFTTKLFDTTFYKGSENSNSQTMRAYSLQIKPANYSKFGIKEINREPENDFIALVNDFKPHLIGLSCVELTYLKGLRLLRSIRELNIPTIVGGVFATFSADEIILADEVYMVCVGDGEKTIVELSRKMFLNEPIEDIPNLYLKKRNKIVRPKKIELTDIEHVSIPLFDIFAPERMYRAMSGKVYRMLPVEFSRGCPYHCTYCSAPSYAKKFISDGRWLRFKTIDQIINEIDFYVKRYKAEYFYFISETFLAMPKEKKLEFYKRYKSYKIPFWFNTRPETINEEDINRLKDVGCHRISIGIESGNESFRKNMLKRNYSNEDVLMAVDIVLRSKIQLSVNNMIGFPDETRDMIFDTIELNREFKADSHTVSIFQPFRGTALYDYCVLKGYWDSKKLCNDTFIASRLDMPTLTKEEIKGFYRTFNLYVNIDKIFWPEIKKAEKFDEEGDKIFFQLAEKLRDGYKYDIAPKR